MKDICQLALKQPILWEQPVSMTDANFRSACYALLIEDNPDQKIQSERKIFAPVALGSKNFSPTQPKMSISSKKFLAINMAFLAFTHILWEASKPTITLSYNKSVIRFFQTKALPPFSWTLCEYMLQFNFKIAQIADSDNTAADFFPEFNRKSQRRSVSKSRRMYKHYPSR